VKTSRNIGGSILPSSSPHILAPIDCAFGRLQVRVLDAEDTHALFLDDTRIASHPNGYSCHCLAARLVAGDAKRVIDQAEYIIACGGVADLEAIRRTVP
jgi:hypothetical protein